MAKKDFRVKLGIEVGANAHIAGSITSVDSVQLDLASPVTNLAAGQISWNEDSNTVSVGLDVGSLELGQEEHIYIKNQSGNTIGKGNTVMFAGTLGNSGRILGTKATMDGTFPSSYFIGLAKHDIENGEDGYVTTFGAIDKLDTSMFSEGDIIYADPGVIGGLSNTAPVAPNNFITVAAVINADNNQGKLFVRPTFAGTLVGKEDVYAPSLSDNNSLVWSSSNSRFEAKTLTAEDVGIDDHLNVSEATANQILSWSGTDYSWISQISPGDPDTAIQINDGGSFTGYADLTYNVSSQTLTANNVSATTVTATDFNSLSDARLKTDVEIIDNSFARLSSLSGITFNFAHTQKRSAGVLAQDVERVLPEAVTTDFRGVKSVSYSAVLALVIQAFKEYAEQAEARISRLEKNNS